jgi:hypothetical protein
LLAYPVIGGDVESTVDLMANLLVIAVPESLGIVQSYGSNPATVQRASVSVPRNSRESIAAFFASVFIAALVGCNSRASQDVYQQRMAGEIRILEDQLYEADYHNRVLNDQLERSQAKVQPSRSGDGSSDPADTQNHSALPPKSSVEAPIPDPIPNTDLPSVDEGQIDMDAGFDPDDLELPEVELGEPADAESIPPSKPPIEAIPLGDPQAIESIPLGDPEAFESIPLGDPEAEDLPAPGLPEPPGKDDTTIPPIDPGRILPPAAGGKEEDSDQPGQIPLPDSLSGTIGIPEQLKIHAGLSSGVEHDDEQNEMTIVIHVVDKLGHTVDLGKFDIDADLSIVLLDPERETSESRIGRWDFSPDQIAKQIQQEPVSAIRVSIKWNGDRPAGKEVLVHARLRAEEDDMRCERRLSVDKKRAIAEWTPRGEDVRR